MTPNPTIKSKKKPKPKLSLRLILKVREDERIPLNIWHLNPLTPRYRQYSSYTGSLMIPISLRCKARPLHRVMENRQYAEKLLIRISIKLLYVTDYLYKP